VFVVAFKEIGTANYAISTAMTVGADPNVIYWTPPAGDQLSTVGLPNCVEANGCGYY
jgi:hypothetical protein